MRTPTPKMGQDSRGYWRVSYYQDGKRKYEYFGKGAQGREIAQKFLADKTQDLYRQDLGMLKEIDAEEFFVKYLEYAQTNKAPLSFQRDALTIKHLLPYIEDKQLIEIGPQVIEKYKANRKKIVKTSTINRDLNTIKAAFRKAVEWGYLKKTPLQAVKKFKEPKSMSRFFSLEEITRILKAITGTELRAAIYLLLMTGMRRDELLHLEWTDIDYKRNCLHVQPKADWVPKDYEARTIPINGQVKEVLLGLSGQDGYVIEQCHPSSLSRAFQRVLKKVGIKNASLHTLRHTYASHLVMSGVDLPTVRKLLGHSEIKTTMRYAHLAPEHLQDAVKKLGKTFCFEFEKKPASNILPYPEKTCR